jgi:hypothetical protein
MMHVIKIHRQRFKQCRLPGIIRPHKNIDTIREFQQARVEERFVIEELKL